MSKGFNIYLRPILSTKLGKGTRLWQKEYTKWELKKFATSAGFECIKSFNCNVKDSLRCGLLLESKRVAIIPNPFYYMSNLLYWSVGKREELFSLIGYHSVFVGKK